MRIFEDRQRHHPVGVDMTPTLRRSAPSGTLLSVPVESAPVGAVSG